MAYSLIKVALIAVFWPEFLSPHKIVESSFYAPNFEEVEGAYWFGPVCPSVRLSVRNTFWKLGNSRTPYTRILKFYIWHIHEK